MTYFDVSVPIREGMIVFPGDPVVSLTKVADLIAGDPCTVTSAVLGLHTGTHIDAPAHFLAGGAGVESVSLDALIGPTTVVDATAEIDHLGQNLGFGHR